MNRSPADQLRALVVKDGVALGGLTAGERTLVFALVWRAVHAAWARRTMPTWPERDVNVVLKQVLSEGASFLATDHVELRRWLVDAQWITRDGFGRAYACVEHDALAPEQQALVDWVPANVAAWVADQRATHAAVKAARRLEWQQRQAAQAKEAKGA